MVTSLHYNVDIPYNTHGEIVFSNDLFSAQNVLLHSTHQKLTKVYTCSSVVCDIKRVLVSFYVYT